MKAKTNERGEVTITANEIITELWKLLNTSPIKTGTLTGSQRAALKLLLEIRGGERAVSPTNTFCCSKQVLLEMHS